MLESIEKIVDEVKCCSLQQLEDIYEEIERLPMEKKEQFDKEYLTTLNERELFNWVNADYSDPSQEDRLRLKVLTYRLMQDMMPAQQMN